MSADNISKLRLYNDTWNTQGMTDENSLANALLTQQDVLSPVLTHLAGREDMRFPLSFLTEGLGNIKTIQDIEYDFPVMGRLNRSVMATDLTGTGIGHSRFYITFEDKWFVKQYLIESPDGIQARIMGTPEQVALGWKYPCELISAEDTAAVSDTDVENKQWVQLFAPVSVSGSRGNYSHWVAPSKMRNQISLMRKSYNYEGNAPNRTVNVEFNIGGRKTTLWYDFEEWQHMLRWKEEIESSYWYSQYNRAINGVIHLKDENGKVIPLGSGVLEQIPNVDSYSILTASKLKNAIRDALYGASDAQDMNIVLFTGLGGMEEFDNAMKSDIASKAYMLLNGSQFVTGSGKNMALGGYFTTYKHIDGHTITVRRLPLFDNGPRALNSDPHPVTGLPLESYRMIFLDMSTYDGEANIKMVAQKNRQLLRWAVAGATIPPGFSGNSLRANDIDGASVHFMRSGGIAIRRATNCLHFQCVRS